MGSQNPSGGVQPPLLHSASSHFSHLSGLLPESGEEEGPSHCSEGNGDERGDRSRKDSFSGLLQSALFSAESPGYMEADNRPLGSEHPHPVSVLQDGDQWVSSQSPSKRAMAHHSGFERRLLSHPDSPLLQALPSVLPRGRGLAIPSSSIWVKHRTTGVYNGHGTCRGLRPSQWGQPPRLSGRLAVKPHVGRVSQTANPMVIGPLRTPRLGDKRGEVMLDSFTGGHLLGNFARYQSRPRLPLREEDRTMALHLGGLPSRTGSACPAMATTFGAPSFPREASSLRPVAYPTHSVPTSLGMVSNQRPSPDPGQSGSRDPGFHSLVENSFESPQRNPTRVSSGRSFPLHRLKCCGLGCSHGREDRLRKVVRGHERAAHQCAGTECDLAWSPSLRGYSPGLQCCHYVRQCLCHCLSEKSGGHSVSTDVPHGHRYLRMGRRTVHDTDTQTSPWASECVSRSSEPQRSDSEHRMESESSRSTACIPSLGQSTSGSVCTQVQHQTSNLHVSDSRTGGLEGRQSSPIMGRSVRLRVPTNGSDQTDSEQVNLAQSGTDSHSPLLAGTGMVSGPPTTVHSFPVGTSTNTKVAEAIILSSLSSEGSDLKPSRVEVICRSNQARGFSEQVSNRIAVPQRKSTLDLYEQKWNTFREWCELNGINPHTPTVPMIADFLLHLFRDKQLATITIKGYRSALSSLMASRGLDISHDPDLNALIRSFSIERPRTVRETPRWDLSLVLRFLMRHPFEPMNVCSLADLTRNTAFLLTLASAKRNSEVWAFSADVVFGHDKQSATLRFLPGFIAKTQKPDRPDTALSPVTIPALAPFTGPDLPEKALCPIRALRYYLSRTNISDPGRSKRLFVSIKPGRQKDIAKATISGWIKGIIRSAYSEAKSEDIPHLTSQNVQARELRAMATSLAFHQHHSLKQVMEAASWRVDSTFASFYLRDLTPAHLRELGPLVAGQSVISDR